MLAAARQQRKPRTGILPAANRCQSLSRTGQAKDASRAPRALPALTWHRLAVRTFRSVSTPCVTW